MENSQESSKRRAARLGNGIVKLLNHACAVIDFKSVIRDSGRKFAR